MDSSGNESVAASHGTHAWRKSQTDGMGWNSPAKPPQSKVEECLKVQIRPSERQGSSVALQESKHDLELSRRESSCVPTGRHGRSPRGCRRSERPAWASRPR